MNKLSNNIERKYVESFDVSDWEIETDTGWKDIQSVSKTIPYDKWELKTVSGKTITGADNHIIFNLNNDEIFIKDCIPNITKIQTIDGPELVKSCDNQYIKTEMYDLDVDGDKFFSNGILSHNSTIVLAYLLHYSLFKENKSVAILANNATIAKELLSRVKKMFENLPKWLQQGIVEWNKGHIEFENGSKIFSSATSANAIRGLSQNIVFLDEFAHIHSKLASEFFASVYPTISSGKDTKVIVVSTPKGLNHYYKLWTDSKTKKNNYIPISVHWSAVPGRDEKWKKETIRNIGETLFLQEFECDFIGSTSTLISSKKLQELNYIDPTSLKNDVSIYNQPGRGNFYVICVDVSLGVGNDFSALVVIDITSTPYKLVAKYRNNKITPMMFPSVIANIGRHYNNAFILVENNNIGSQVCDILYHDEEYENLIFTKSMGRKGTSITGGFGKNTQIGIKTTSGVKRIGCSNLKTIIESDQLLIQDFDIIIELSNFVNSGNSFQAEEGENDDLVMTLVLFAWMTTQRYFKELTNLDIREKLIAERIAADENSLLPFGFIENGINDDITIDVDGTEWYSTDEDSSNW